jgi:hypothetical protein
MSFSLTAGKSLRQIRAIAQADIRSKHSIFFTPEQQRSYGRYFDKASAAAKKGWETRRRNRRKRRE